MTIERQRQFIRTSDGRALETHVAGPPDGTVLVFHTGTPSAGELFEPMLAEAARHDLRTVTWSRPGYAGSTRLEGRTVADVATDVATVLDALDADRCFVIGWSGGGPHALATAALLPQRVMGAATIASVAPFEAEGLDWLAGMGLENVDEFSAVVEGPEKLRTYLEGFAGALAGITASDVADSLGDLIPAVDRSALTGEFAEAMAASLRASVSSGIDGWLDDDLAFVRPWGFELDTIRVPLTVWQGQQDRMVPFSHGQWLASHIPGAQARLHPEHGHLSLAVDAFGLILDELVHPGH